MANSFHGDGVNGDFLYHDGLKLCLKNFNLIRIVNLITNKT